MPAALWLLHHPSRAASLHVQGSGCQGATAAGHAGPVCRDPARGQQPTAASVPAPTAACLAAGCDPTQFASFLLCDSGIKEHCLLLGFRHRRRHHGPLILWPPQLLVRLLRLPRQRDRQAGQHAGKVRRAAGEGEREA